MVPREFQARVYLAEVDKLSANNLRINMTKGIKKALVLSLAGLLVFSFAVLPVIADAGMRDGWRDRDWRDGRRDRDWGGHFDGRFGRGGFGNRLGNIGEPISDIWRSVWRLLSVLALRQFGQLVGLKPIVPRPSVVT